MDGSNQPKVLISEFKKLMVNSTYISILIKYL